MSLVIFLIILVFFAEQNEPWLLIDPGSKLLLECFRFAVVDLLDFIVDKVKKMV